MVNIKIMNIKRLITKYSILLIIYIVLIRFIQPFGLRLYYSVYSNPDMATETVNTIQSIFTSVTFLLNLIFVIFILVDAKQKRAVDWLIAIITFFSAETGIVLFLIWQIYKEINKKYEAYSSSPPHQ